MRFSATRALLALALLWTTPAVAQQTAGATIRGVVTDSVAGAPLASVTIQLVQSNAQAPAARTAVSDSLGRFEFVAVAEGSYMIGFLHPVLDSLGLEPIARAVAVPASGEVRADLAIPAPARLRSAFCGAEGGGGLVMGFVRAARGGAPVAGATVRGEWLEIAIARGSLAQQTARRSATTGANGGFVLCDLPSPGSVLLQVSQAADSTDRVEAEIPAGGFLRRDLYLGESRTTRADTAGFAPRTGPGQLSGVVVTSEGGRPLANAQMRVVNGEPARANERGEWTLTGAPSGTRVLEVRAPGYYPVRRAVDIADGAPAVRVPLSRLAAMLDTIRVVSRTSRSLGGFLERKNTLGTGRFITGDEIARRRLLDTSEIFATIPGLVRERVSGEEDLFYMRGIFADRCAPAVVLNGTIMRNLSTNDISQFVRPADIAAMEVYQESQVPPQFQDALSGCGSIVIWTK